ncbi:hypothetical protein Tco_0660855 [Tanacetum coccineum]
MKLLSRHKPFLGLNKDKSRCVKDNLDEDDDGLEDEGGGSFTVNSWSFSKIDFYVYGIENMIKHTENSFLSLLFMGSGNEPIRRIERGSLVVDQLDTTYVIVGYTVLGIDSTLVPSFFKIFDLKPLSLSFDFVFSFEIFKSLSFRLDRLCHLAILCLDQHAYTLHHLESLLTISLDRLDIFEGRSCISEFVRKSLSLILELS